MRERKPTYTLEEQRIPSTRFDAGRLHAQSREGAIARKAARKAAASSDRQEGGEGLEGLRLGLQWMVIWIALWLVFIFYSVFQEKVRMVIGWCVDGYVDGYWMPIGWLFGWLTIRNHPKTIIH